MILYVYIDEQTASRLKKLARELDRTIEDLAESAVAEAVLDAFRGRPRG